MTTAVSPQHFDVIIVGGGMVGAALGCTLAARPLKIAVVEAQPAEADWPAESFDLRVSAINRASQRLFEGLGVWQAMVAERVTPYREMVVWDASGQGRIQFDSADIGEPDLGHIIENRVITRALSQRLATLDPVCLIAPGSPSRLRRRPDGHNELQLADGQWLAAPLLVGADGAQSWVRPRAGIEVSTQPYHQRAVVCTVRTERPHGDTAWQRFLPLGPLAFLPLTQGWSSIVWSTSPEQAEALLAAPEAEFRRQLGEAFDHTLGEITAAGPRASFALLGQHARRYVKPGVALIGDAAHAVHPLAGQGVNLGFADVAALAAALRDVGPTGAASYRALRAYERARKGDNLLMLEGLGLLNRLFANTSPWVREVRNSALSLTDHLPAAKHLFMRQAMGLSLFP